MTCLHMQEKEKDWDADAAKGRSRSKREVDSDLLAPGPIMVGAEHPEHSHYSTVGEECLVASVLANAAT